ncbi:MAG: dTMP kinase [Thaumarchaeota archaeon]|nr:dTMP kinase [Nitrososphaerota archaeon]
MAQSKSGLLIGVEGIDAVGKRTQTSLLTTWFHSKSVTVSTISFPDYSTPIGREIKHFFVGEKNYSPEVRSLLFAANRWERKAELEGMMSRSEAVIVNRYSESNLAYGTSIGLRLDWLLGLESGLPRADLVLVLDAPADELYRRRGLNKDRYERDTALQERARKSYLELSAKFGWKVIDATQGVQQTSSAMTAAVSQLLAEKRGTV